MDGLDTSAFEMIRALRDEIELRIAQTDDFRALMALNAEIQSYERHIQSNEALKSKLPPLPADAPAQKPLVDFDLKVFLPPPQETRRWWRKLG